MQIWYSSSSESKKCAKCGKMTASYKVYEQTNISIRIPLCQTETRDCYEKVDIESLAELSIKIIKKEITK